ncbi:DUF2309 family protein [Terrilactibacillus sp. BCM23-1]|uniref:Probable inorganic carbon transporter subunit DabA n=1 Tax=Terrilactibacillus tamarindi TaxID=2599694 RepID=A0A6N8CKX8_9BACI|nr:putative inorganic carbon transporter subunit DabA [Terrilactibacillus tamarindi]MTT30464.1 DUF2309 family protein [Terrilactibacillus tamarindi]
MNTTLHQENVRNFLRHDMDELVKSASNVIAPFGPINKFGARTPWSGLEDRSFEQVARKLKDICDVEIYPNDSVIQSAWNRGEINQDLLESRLRHWLDLQDLEISRDVAEQFCWATLMQEERPSNVVNDPKLKSLAKKLSHFKFQMTETYSVRTYSQRLELLGGARVAHDLNRHMIKWCKLFLDESQAVWSMPNRKEGFYQAWRRIARHDPALNRMTRKQISTLPKDADHALKEALQLLEVPYEEIQGYLEAHLLALPGWAGMLLWRSQHRAEERSLLSDYLAIRLSLELILVKPFLHLTEQRSEDKVVLEPLIASWVHFGNLPIGAWPELSSAEQKARLILAFRFDKIVRNQLWLEAWEMTYEDQLKKMITSKQMTEVESVKPIAAQFAFCIDVRSELFRRKLEKAGPFATFGTAGFFGLPIETNELGCMHGHSSLPVMKKPQFKIKEYLPELELKQYEEREQTDYSISSMFKSMKNNMLASLVLPEVSGPWLSLQTLARSIAPRTSGRVFRKIRKTWLRKPSTELSLDHVHTSDTELPIGFTGEQKVYYARQALKMMGLTDHFSPLVVICGHGSQSTNNPYASSLDCGACGGASSGFNARVLATLCNLQTVRRALADEGISIPKETVFVAAEHITTLDELHWLYVPELSDAAEKSFRLVEKTMPKVSEEANAERILKLPNINSSHKNPKREAERLAEDWSEIRPEWGLARNASFIIGDRELTKECNLNERSFLHNYNWKKDLNGDLLAAIIAGPGTVAQWINLQYYASTVAPHYYGSGSKTTQTVTSGIGVMQGNSSDLLTGLPWQSVMQSDQEAYHAPLRLLVVIQAPNKYVKRLLDHDKAFHQKVHNGWIRLASIDPEGNWISWS